MSDLIDRQELIYSLECLPFYHQFWKPEGCEGLWESEAVVNRIKNMPPAQQWIPVTERLPEELEAVNITWTNTDPPSYYEFIKGVPFTATGVYYKGEWYWYSANVIDLLSEGYKCETMDKKIKVVAWMPLPTPWKGEKNDK